MTQERKNFNYKSASQEELIAHFQKSTRQAISAARKFWAYDEAMTAKLDDAFYLLKKAQFEAKFGVNPNNA